VLPGWRPTLRIADVEVVGWLVPRVADGIDPLSDEALGARDLDAAMALCELESPLVCQLLGRDEGIILSQGDATAARRLYERHAQPSLGATDVRMRLPLTVADGTVAHPAGTRAAVLLQAS
jgi:hypothetical protein